MTKRNSTGWSPGFWDFNWGLIAVLIGGELSSEDESSVEIRHPFWHWVRISDNGGELTIDVDSPPLTTEEKKLVADAAMALDQQIPGYRVRIAFDLMPDYGSVPYVTNIGRLTDSGLAHRIARAIQRQPQDWSEL